jgi:hypothetical protein
METEAWFLGEYRHLTRVSRILTPGYISKHFGFNPKMEKHGRQGTSLRGYETHISVCRT